MPTEKTKSPLLRNLSDGLKKTAEEARIETVLREVEDLKRRVAALEKKAAKKDA